eukprot:102145-Pelagomonas_calceolata.AAC.1
MGVELVIQSSPLTNSKNQGWTTGAMLPYLLVNFMPETLKVETLEVETLKVETAAWDTRNTLLCDR